MKNMFICRHGRYSKAFGKLTADGRLQVRTAAEWVATQIIQAGKSGKVFLASSPTRRAAESGEIYHQVFNAFGLEHTWEMDSRLKDPPGVEPLCGTEGRPDYTRFVYEWWTHNSKSLPRNAESYEHLLARVADSAVHVLSKTNVDDTAVIVCHRGVIEALLDSLADMRLPGMFDFAAVIQLRKSSSLSPLFLPTKGRVVAHLISFRGGLYIP